MADPAAGRRTWRQRLRRAVLALAVAYPLALVAVLAVLRGIGERWWVATILLYLPRVGWGLPLPFLTLALLLVRPRRWLLTQAMAAALLAFPLMGLRLGGEPMAAAGGARLRVMSCNIDRVSMSARELAAIIRDAGPDVVCLQEARGDEVAPLARQLPGYVVRGDGQFVVASKYPIADVYLPPRISVAGETNDANFVRYRIETPVGVVDLYNIHPVSPHSGFDHLRGGGLLSELASGRFFVNHDAFRRLGKNARLRELQARAAVAHAGRSPFPVIIAGDTNLPTASWIYGQTLAAYQDGFAVAARGFGYTFPAKRLLPWLRLDRILADRSFRFVTFARLHVHVSTHFPVVADLERTPDGGARTGVTTERPLNQPGAPSIAPMRK